MNRLPTPRYVVTSLEGWDIPERDDGRGWNVVKRFHNYWGQGQAVIDEPAELTLDQIRERIAALGNLRWFTVNRARTWALAHDSDMMKLGKAGFSAHRYERAPGVWDYEGTCDHPEIVRAAAEAKGLSADG